MENNIMDDNFYKQLTEDEKQLCDLCRDWNLGECEKCEFVSLVKTMIRRRKRGRKEHDKNT